MVRNWDGEKLKINKQIMKMKMKMKFIFIFMLDLIRFQFRFCSHVDQIYINGN